MKRETCTILAVAGLLLAACMVVQEKPADSAPPAPPPAPAQQAAPAPTATATAAPAETPAAQPDQPRRPKIREVKSAPVEVPAEDAGVPVDQDAGTAADAAATGS